MRLVRDGNRILNLSHLLDAGYEPAPHPSRLPSLRLRFLALTGGVRVTDSPGTQEGDLEPVEVKPWGEEADRLWRHLWDHAKQEGGELTPTTGDWPQ